MKQATKGALAAATAVALLSGGAGTLAYWTGTQDVVGGDISAGKLTLGDPKCDGSVAGTHDWKYADGTSYTKIVPGDTVTKVCAVTLDLDGDHIGAKLGVSQPTLAADTGTLAAELQPTATFKVDNSSSDDQDKTVSTAGPHTVLATVSVTFPGAGATNDSQAVAATLSAITITATQTHA